MPRRKEILVDGVKANVIECAYCGEQFFTHGEYRASPFYGGGWCGAAWTPDRFFP